MQKPGTCRHLLKPSFDNSFSCFNLILYLFSHQTWLGPFCCCWHSSVLPLLYVESSSRFIVAHGAEPRCAELLPLIIFIVKLTSTLSVPQNIPFILLSCPWVAQVVLLVVELNQNPAWTTIFSFPQAETESESVFQSFEWGLQCQWNLNWMFFCWASVSQLPLFFETLLWMSIQCRTKGQHLWLNPVLPGLASAPAWLCRLCACPCQESAEKGWLPDWQLSWAGGTVAIRAELSRLLGYELAGQGGTRLGSQVARSPPSCPP